MGKDKTKISPKVKIYDIFGKGLILNPRPSLSDYGWLAKSPEKLDFLTGAPLTVAGDLPVICSHTVMTQGALSLLEKASLEVAPYLYVYRTEKEYEDLLNSLSRKKKKIVFNHAHPEDEMEHERYWISPNLLVYLNNKANLNEIVPSDNIPLRKITPLSQIKKVINEFAKLPLVIKAATNHPTGAGRDVIICRNTKDIDRACNYFSTSQNVVVEDFIEINKNFNIQFAATRLGHIIYLGASEQINTPAGNYSGNWLFKDKEPPKSVVELGRKIMKHACRLGFFGVGGFDIAISKDNRVLAIDLNFRLNGSTPALLMKDSIMRCHNASVLLFRTWKAVVNWNRFFSICKELIESKYLVPIAIYNPLANPFSGPGAMLSGILTGTSKKDILNKQLQLEKSGLT